MTLPKPNARFYDRTRAGSELAAELRRFLQGQQPVVLVIPPDGVPVAARVASELGAPLDVIVSRRIGVPQREGDTLGAVTPDRTLVINKATTLALELSDEEIEQLSISVWTEAQGALHRYRGERPYLNLHGRTAVIIDDGMTTGYTAMAAVVSARKLEPERVVLAVPVASVEAIERLGSYADEVLSLEICTDDPFCVADHYANYAEYSEQEVIWTLEQFWSERPPQGRGETF